jgi:hypothetical protein
MKILVTGSEGYLGSFLGRCRAGHSTGVDTFVGADDENEFRVLYSAYCPDAVCH